MITPGAFGKCPLPRWPEMTTCRKVSEVMQFTLPVKPARAAVLLTPYETRQFSQHKLLSEYLLPSNGPVQTALHSWGNQVYPCPCGCRTRPFTQQRLDEGIHAVVVLSHGMPESESKPTPRHLAPEELALLNGAMPTQHFGNDDKLAICLIGQFASPLQSAWICGCLLQFLFKQGQIDWMPPDPERTLAYQRQSLLLAAAAVGLRAVQDTDVESISSDHSMQEPEGGVDPFLQVTTSS